MPPSPNIRHGALQHPTTQLRREITCIIPSCILGRTPSTITTKRKRIQLRSLLLLLLIILLLLSRILMMLLRRKLEPSKPTLVPRIVITNMSMRRPPLPTLLLLLPLCKLRTEALSDTLTRAATTRQK